MPQKRNNLRQVDLLSSWANPAFLLTDLIDTTKNIVKHRQGSKNTLPKLSQLIFGNVPVLNLCF